MESLSDVKRTKVAIHPDDDPPEDAAEYGEIRVYFDPDNDLPPMPSVSVVKALRTDPEKKEMLDGWRSRYDGKSQWSRPWHEDQKVFKGYRGTLIHYAILSALDDDPMGETYFHQVGDTDWGYEEYYAKYALKKWSKHAPSANTDEVPYTPRNNEYDGEHAWDRCVRDMKWATRSFKRTIIDGDTSSTDDVATKELIDNSAGDGILSQSDVIDVETYVYDEEYGYGGQFDLLYEDADGNTVLADVKTSSGVRFDHKLQSAAYKHALESQGEHTVDRCEILRLHPDSEEVEISSSDDWQRTLQGLEHEFLALVDECHNCVYNNTLRDAELELMSDRTRTEQSELASAAD